MDDIKEVQTPVAIEAYYIVPKNGGFQLRRLHIEDDIVLLDIKVSDPDAWNQVMSEIEQELSKKFE